MPDKPCVISLSSISFFIQETSFLVKQTFTFLFREKSQLSYKCFSKEYSFTAVLGELMWPFYTHYQNIYRCYQLKLVFQSFSSILSKRIKLRSSLNKFSASFPGKRGERNLSRLNPYSLSRFQNIPFILPKLCQSFSRFHGSTLPTGFVQSSDSQLLAFYAA